MTLLMRDREKYKEGIADGRAEGMAEGEIKGAIQVCKNFQLSFQETVQYLMDIFHLPLFEAEEDVNRYWES